MGTKKPKKTETEEQKKLREAAAAEKAKESKEADSTEADKEEGDEADGEGSGGDGEHDDEDKDIELIKKMIGEYMGDDAKKLSPEEHEALSSLGKEAYQGHVAMGKKEDEAYKHAGEAIKLAHHMAGKKKAEADKEEGDDAAATDDKKVPPKKDGDKDTDKAEADEKKEADEKEADANECDDKKESAKVVKELRTKLLEAEGRNAKLVADQLKSEVGGYVDSKLRESGQPKSITKTFREKFGPFKSKAAFDASWGAFLEGVKQTKSGTDWGLMMEKATTDEDGRRVSDKKDGLDFSDCAED